MSDNEYILAWVAYLSGAVLFYMAFCYATRWIGSFEFRYMLRLPLAAILFAPAYADPAQDFLAPAVVVALFDLTSHEPDLGVRGVKLILWIMGFLLVLLLLESGVRRAWVARRLRQSR
jgi:hypothetical protein